MRACLSSISIPPTKETKETKQTKNQPFHHRGKKYSVNDVMTMFANAIGNITFQPNRIN
jgi:hypothetical protein